MEREIGNFYIEGYNFDTKTYDNKDNTLLLVIDLQEKLMPAIYESDRIIKNSACLLKVFEMYGIKKIATEQYPKGLGQSVDEIKENLDDEYIFSKTSFDAITDEVSSYLKENKITNVIITGAETHICVYQTVRRLLFEGYKVFVVEDAVSSFNKEQKDLGLKAMSDMGASLVNTEMLMFDLASDAKDENFKEISKMVKNLRK
ncbi:MAG: isochorismatase family protein [Anaerococcus vaginalis]|uniref:Nicotinamidase/pyrazinamidase n=1 Tax=Anaerococcus vaginalis TaxID=33037 RepID=A0A6N2UF36_9FIRM|nr:isochorismatase family protein [Anaerococcus vaginalis]MDU0944884.1 isochorismatase family protein [Anaerococcus vaginalis]MDU1030406.1 isochorismatase family protein [Anaerococcus vaginalis]MDU4448173.1 isochorismatase family protein [Anaerococcus vaginalis]MDU7432700.1 isochorismatase family protein [Anaerococcus vaginalis]